MPLTFQKFSPLIQSQIDQIIENAGAVIPPVATKARTLVDESQQYQDLIQKYSQAPDKKNFLNDGANQQAIAKFLNECGLMGYVSESSPLSHGSYAIGAEGIAIILAYLKEKNPQIHEIEAVKNTNLKTKLGSPKYADIFLEQNQVHDALKASLIKDLKKPESGEEKPFNKTYIVQVHGATGGSHFVALTIRKEVGENNPLVHLFDPSPPLLRNGLEATQNNTAYGWNSQLKINATVKKAFEEIGLTFDLDRYFNNSEPQQHRGFVYCGTFACEAGVRIASLSRERHKALLENYRFPSLFGGRTEVGCRDIEGREMPLSIAQIVAEGGFIKEPILGLSAGEVTMSHFVDPALSKRQAELGAINHPRKSGRDEETELDHVIRYQSKEEASMGYNLMVEQKALRQKIGHLFEIVSNHNFLSRANGELMIPNPFDYSPYGPKQALEPAQDTKDLIDAFKKTKILPPPLSIGGVNSSHYDGDICAVTNYIGEISGARLLNFFNEKNLRNNGLELVDFSQNVVGVDPAFSRFYKISVEIPKARFTEIAEALKAQTYQPAEHLFTPKKTATMFERTQLSASLNQEQER